MIAPVNRFSARDVAVDREGRFTSPILFALNKLVSIVGGRDGILPPAFNYTLQDGSVSSPAISFVSEPALGWYRSGPGTLGIAASSQNIVDFSVDGVNIATIPPNAAVINDAFGNLAGLQLADGELMMGITGAIPIAGAVSGTANQVIVSNGPGSITLSAPQDIDATSSPTFDGLSLTGLNVNGFLRVIAGGVINGSMAATNGQLLIGSTGNPPQRSNLTGTANQVVVTDGPGSITLSLPQNIHAAATPTFDALTLTNGFGCNGKTPQTEVTVNAAVAGTAGAAYTATEQAIINNLVTLVNQLRAALVANGIAV